MLNLKNETKELFKKAGLENFTISRKQNGCLELVGDCGKPLVQITNFSVGSKLTKKEREICIDDYIQPALTKHSKSILELVDAKKDEKRLEEIVETAKEDTEKSDLQYNFYIKINYASKYNDIEYYSLTIVKFKKEKNKTIMTINICYESDKDNYEINIQSEKVSILTNTLKDTKDCKKHLDDLKKDIDKYINARLKTRVTEEKLRIACEI